VRARLLVLIVAAGSAARVEAQQQGSVQVSTETQVVQGNDARRGTEHAFEPDVGLLWTRPATRFGEFQLELRGSRRGEDFHLGRTWLALRDAKARGASWTFQGGDLYTTPILGNYQFTNLSAPAITFTGGTMVARSSTSSAQVVVGRATALRNIFGTDPDALDQSLLLGRMSRQVTDRIELTARGSRVRTGNLKEFPHTIDASDQAGGGVRFLLTPSIHLIGDGTFVHYRATGAADTVNDYSFLAGAHVLVARGWMQINASRFSPGDLPVLNATLQDRRGVFSAGEYDLFSRTRLFGGWETLDSNINPTGTALLRPVATATRGFGGVRVRLAPRSTLTVRLEDGDRQSHPAALAPGGTLLRSTSDTGSLSAELQTNAGRMTAFGRYSRRENVDSALTTAIFTQNDATAQAYLSLSRRSQLFGSLTLTNQHSSDGAASTFLQVGAGGQQQVFRQGLWLRVEGNGTRNEDLVTGVLVPREALSIGLNGQLARNTTIGLNVYADRAPIGVPGDPSAWLTRSTIRIVHTIPTGSVRVGNGTSASSVTRTARGTGTIAGSVFADWNGNGRQDPGEETLAGIPIALGTISHVTTGRDGQFAFLNVPGGAQEVRLDLNALPVDFDAPADTAMTLEVGRGDTRRVNFGLIPLGGVRGRIVEDANKNGQIDPGEPSVAGAVLVLDAGQRSEVVRNGQFRFEAVRAGDHRIELLKDSLPEGATIVGDAERSAPIGRERPEYDLTYLVTIEKRPEVRRVFPARGGGPGGGAATAPGRGGTTPGGRGATPGGRGATAAGRGATTTPGGAVTRSRPPSTRPHGPSVPVRTRTTVRAYTIQIAALVNAENARALTAELKSAGFAAYLVVPPPEGDSLYRVRVGHYATRAAAQATVDHLEQRLGLKLWVTRNR
jgi:hypothetical protein